MMKRQIVCFSLLIAVVTVIFGQDNEPVFENIQEGLSNNYVRCILKDSWGFMWFGTYNGLNKFDGTTITEYEHNPDDSSSISHDVINGMVEDKHHNIWIATGEGLDIYDRKHNDFITIDHAIGDTNNLSDVYLTSLFADENGTIWMGTLGYGLTAYNKEKKILAFYSLAFSTSDLTPNYINCLTPEDSGKIWIGTRKGIYLFDIANRKTVTLHYRKSCHIRLDDKQINCMTKDISGNLWVATSEGMLLKIIHTKEGYDIIRRKMLNSSAKDKQDKILVLKCNNKNNLYVGRENSGLEILNINSGKVRHYHHVAGNPNSIASNSILAIYFDNTGKTWIGTYTKGVCLIDKYYKKFDSYQRNIYTNNTLVSNDVKAFSEANKGRIWIGTVGGGISIFDEKKNDFVRTLTTKSKPQLSSNEVTSLLHDSDGNMWVGYWAGGIDRINKTNSSVTNFPVKANGAEANNILRIYEDKKKNIWVGTAASGLFLYDRQKGEFHQTSTLYDGIPVPSMAYVTSILEDSDSALWVGTLYGLFELHRKENGRYSSKSYYHNANLGSVSSNQITTIFEDHNKDLWFGTFDNGLDMLEKKGSDFKVFYKKNGLASNTIKGILEDRHGNLWVSTNKGITKFNPAKRTFVTYTKGDGLVTNEFYLESCLSSTNNRFYFGCDNGFNTFYPDSISIDPIKPVIYFTRLMINNEPVKIGTKGSPLTKDISETKNITLNHKQISFTLSYVGLGYTRTSGNRYAHKLEGFDNSWKYVGNSTSVSYTNLNPGTYHLLVKGTNNDGIWCSKPAELTITVKPPFWKSWWALIAYILVILSSVYFVVRLRIERIKIKNSLALERMAREKDQELNQAKLQFFTNISHEFRTPLSLILGPLERVLNSMELSSKMQWQAQMARKNSIRLAELVNELMDFRKIDNRKMSIQVQETDIVTLISELAGYFKEIAGKKEIDYKVVFSQKDILGWIDRKKLEKILNNILSNAFKYTPKAGKISLKAHVRSQPVDQQNENNLLPDPAVVRYLNIEVSDNGKGITPEDLPHIFDRFYQAKSSTEQGTGIGLTLAKSLIEIHRGTIEVESTLGKGTSFVVKVPIDKEVYAQEELEENPADIEEFGTALIPADDDLFPTEYSTEDNNGESPELLIVEDNDELRTYLAGELKDLFNISLANDGNEGVEKALSELPDLIVSDVMMPGMNGIELCKKLKTDKTTSHIPIILLTAKSTLDDQIKGVEEGADVYITKPFSIRFLKAQISQMIRNRHDLYARFSQEVYIIPSQFAKNKLDEEFLRTIIDYIVANISDSQLGVETIADAIKLSRGQVYRKIKALTGKTAVEFIRNIRLKEAVKLMETRKYSLAEIAYETGFTSPSYFTRSFKNQYGKAPSDYMKI